MIKQSFKIITILLLSIFSFYYTNKSIELIRKQDPIMKTIISTEEKYKIPAQDAIIKANTIIPGKNGMEIDYNATYNKMKQYGSYNEVLTTLKEVKPTVTVEDYYDKFIISGNPQKKSVALVFKVEKKSPNIIVKILNQKDALGTFFIDGYYLENNYEEISTMTNHQLEILSYNSDYDELYFTSSKDYLESLVNKKLKYCYSDYDKEEVITLCQKLKMHTILPTVKINSSLFQEIKEKLTNSAIISIPVSSSIEKELSTTIDYIKSRGYKITTLENLINESAEK